jgi:transcriptional regulator with PAS, ATPase and Fis domain
MQQVMRMCWKVAASSSLFCMGGNRRREGAGGRLYSSSSDRSNKPFVAINCATIPDELWKRNCSVMKKDLFTGAKRSGKKGILEDAHEGTLFLDEIGELPLKMQSKLLRFLQEGNFRESGATSFSRWTSAF